MDRYQGRQMTLGENTRQQATDAWSREVQWVREEARRLGLELDEAELAFQDARDLPALRASLHGLRTRQTKPRWMTFVWDRPQSPVPQNLHRRREAPN